MDQVLESFLLDYKTYFQTLITHFSHDYLDIKAGDTYVYLKSPMWWAGMITSMSFTNLTLDSHVCLTML